MMAHSFYHVIRTEEQTAVALILVNSDMYAQKRGLSELEQQHLAALQFCAKLGEVVPWVDEHGELAKVFIGAENSSDDQAIAAAMTRLPVASYYSNHPLSPRAVLLWSLAQYQYDAFRTVRMMPRVLWVSSEHAKTVIPQAEAVFLVRDLINAPANTMGPEALADVMQSLAKQHQAVMHQWIGDDLLRDNFPAIHAVGRASVSAPRLLMLSWGDESHPRVTLVGKGVCFDSGGLDLKPAPYMRLMKKDMGGAAQVLGLAQWLMTMQAPIRLQVLIPAVENAVGPDAYRPGDVLVMRNGMRVEIDNTDAEGRLVLADALAKACEDRPELLIDFATLTGAARIAVGTDISAMFCNDDLLAEQLTTWGSKVKDPIWRMPLHSGYQSLFESKIADIANSSSSPYAGAIIAALFLQYFVSEDIPWVHFDIMAWNVASTPGKPEGGEAMAMLAVGNYVLQRYSRRCDNSENDHVPVI